MAVGRSFRIVYNRIPAIAKRLQPAASEIVDETMAEALATALQLVPVDTGELKASIGIEKEGIAAAVLFASAAHAIYVEYGTSRMAAQPFLTPAIEAAKPGFMAKMRNLESRLG